MKVFKKVLFILLALSMVCCFVGCPGTNDGPTPDGGSDIVIDGDDSGNTGNEGGDIEGDTPVTPPAGDEGGDVEGDTPVTKGTYAWNFQDLNLEGIGLIDANGNTFTGVAGENTKFTFAKGVTVTYPSRPAGLDLILTNGSGSYNKAKTTQSLGSGSEIGSEGAIEPSKVDMIYCELKGPFTAKMIYGANSKDDKTGRVAQIAINGEVVASGADNKVPVKATTLEYAYTGTDTVKVYFGGNNIVRIYDIEITK